MNKLLVIPCQLRIQDNPYTRDKNAANETTNRMRYINPKKLLENIVAITIIKKSN